MGGCSGEIVPCHIPPCLGWNMDLKPGPFSRDAPLEDRNTGEEEDFPGEVEPEAGVLPKALLKYLIFLI